ncbi:MAG: S46 family peptidase, partial [Bacteroidales bacterium]|nr:S46 family peptidase [Bacteroidales bacterium]
MKKKLLFACVALLALAPLKTRADEGMWLPFLVQKLNIEQMHKLGLKLSAQDIYDINNSSLKDAIVQFGGGCTGEIVSPEGLLFTNHHCGYGQIQSHSTVEHDYLTDGFWAMTKAEELPCPGLTVKFLVRMEDISDKVLASLHDGMSEGERADSAKAVAARIAEEAEEGGRYLVHTKSYFEGNEYYMLVYEEYKDVRLVGTPPEAIGKFGADADNWMWPRHTGDFSIFRVYMSPDGKPAEYSENNVPLKPKHYLPVSIAGIEKDDYAMIMGYPGSTSRFMPSWGVQEVIDYVAPATVNTRRAKLDVLDKYMAADPAVRIKYASIYAQIANYWKNFMGQEIQLKKNHVVEKKQQIEKQFAEWAADKDEYRNVLAELQQSYETLAPMTGYNRMMQEIISGPQVFMIAFRNMPLAQALERK